MTFETGGMKRRWSSVCRLFSEHIQVRLTCYFLLVLLPLVAVSLYANFQSQRILEVEAGERTKGALLSAADSIDRTLQHVEQLSALLSSDYNLNQALEKAGSRLDKESILDFARMVKDMTNITSANRLVYEVAIYHSSSQMLLSTGLGGKRVNGVANTDWFQKAVLADGGSVLHLPRGTDPLFDADAIHLMRTMDLLHSSSRQDVLIVSVKKAVLLDMLKSLLPSDNADLFLTAADGRPVISTDEGLAATDWPRGGEKTPLTLSPPDGEAMFQVSAVAPYSNWSLVMVQPLRELHARTGPLKTFTYAIIAVSVGLALWISWIVFSGISSPLERLSHGMKQVRMGMLDVRLTNNRRDELGYLTESFNQMVLDQKRLIRDYYEQQLQLSKTELQFLQSQINPHFLYNTLDSIYWTAENYEADEISEMVLNLSKFFRLSLNKGGDSFTVAETVEHLHYYVRIQQIRFLDHFTVTYDIAENTKQVPLLKLLLQPLVENAILHGLEKKDGGGRLLISSCIRESSLLLRVEDNGLGIDAGRLSYIRNELSRISGGAPPSYPIEREKPNDLFGLRNVAARIKMVYGEEAELRIDSSPEEGTAVELALPLARCLNNDSDCAAAKLRMERGSADNKEVEAI